MIPDRGPDSVLRHLEVAGPPPPFVVDWAEWGDACRHLARRIERKAELEGRRFEKVFGCDLSGNVLAHTLSAMTGLPVAWNYYPDDLVVLCAGVAREYARHAGPDAIEVAVVAHRDPAPVGCQSFFTIAPGRRIIWPWQA